MGIKQSLWVGLLLALVAPALFTVALAKEVADVPVPAETPVSETHIPLIITNQEQAPLDIAPTEAITDIEPVEDPPTPTPIAPQEPPAPPEIAPLDLVPSGVITTIVIVTETTIVTETMIITGTEEALAIPVLDLSVAFITLNLAAGFALDPFVVSVNGGGAIDARSLSPGCQGHISPNPTVTLNWSGTAAYIELFSYSDQDPVLVVRTPDGSYLCNDDANVNLLDAVIEIGEPQPGQYHIWVGSYHPNQLLPALLVMTSNPATNIGTFHLDQLVRRPPLPKVLIQPQDLAGAAIMSVQEAQSAPNIQSFAATDPPLTLTFTSAGETPAFELPTGTVVCTGYVDTNGVQVLDWSGQTAMMRLFFEADRDATLMVVAPGGVLYCNDDATPGNLNPLIEIPNPVEGVYLVAVGRVNLDQPVTGQLTVTTDQDATPTVLAPEVN
jgi:hypothetical protein